MKNEVKESIIIGADYEEYKIETYRGLEVTRVVSVGDDFNATKIAQINSGTFHMDMYFVENMFKGYHEMPVFYSSSINNYIFDAGLTAKYMK